MPNLHTLNVQDVLGMMRNILSIDSTMLSHYDKQCILRISVKFKLRKTISKRIVSACTICIVKKNVCCLKFFGLLDTTRFMI